MRKILIVLALFAILLTAISCQRETTSNVSVDAIWEKMRETAAFSQPSEENLLDCEIAEKFGISLESIKDGKVFYDRNPINADKVIIIKANGDSSVEKIERALSSEKIRLVDALENDSNQQKKANNIITKTIGYYCLLIISGNASELEKIFDKAVR